MTSDRGEGSIAEALFHAAKKSKKDRKKVLNTCALVLRVLADEDIILDDVELRSLSGKGQDGDFFINPQVFGDINFDDLA